MIELYNHLMELCAGTDSDSSKFFYKDFTGPSGQSTFRIFSYHYASYSDWLKDGALECRGIMFKINDDVPVEIVSRPMQKFFNIYENPFTMDIDINSVEYVMNKEDGSLVSTYLDNGYLYIKSKTSLYSEQAVAASMFINTMPCSKMRARVTELAEAGYTVNFEYVSPTNRVVLSYETTSIIILNVRHNETGEYVPYADLFADADLRPYLVKAEYINDPDNWVKTVKAETGIEGYVGVMQNGSFFKIKTNWYCALHHTKDSITSNERLFGSIVASTADDLRAMFYGDEYAVNKINAFEEVYLDYLRDSIKTIEDFYSSNKGKSRKDYALAAKQVAETTKTPFIFSVMMQMYSGTMNCDSMLESLEKLFLKYWEQFVPSEYEKNIVLVTE